MGFKQGLLGGSCWIVIQGLIPGMESLSLPWESKHVTHIYLALFYAMLLWVELGYLRLVIGLSHCSIWL